jgi:Reverse transcriptase (RNA-dependent DNA polymerase)
MFKKIDYDAVKHTQCFLVLINLFQNSVDPCVFSGKFKESLCVLAVYVNDLQLLSDGAAVALSLESILWERFEISNCLDVNCILGIEIQVQEGKLHASQTAFIDSLVMKFFKNETITEPKIPMLENSFILLLELKKIDLYDIN